jgi:serine/threonine-protein kinase
VDLLLRDRIGASDRRLIGGVWVDLTGRHLGQYQILTRIGGGGMGTVYRAYDPRLQRQVAIKVLRPELTDDPVVQARFQREAVVVAGLRHPNIVVVHDVGAVDGQHYIVMELLQGHTLVQEIEQRGAFLLGDAAGILAQLASALDYAHHCGLVHRDVKSSNVMVGEDARVTLMDFGLVKPLRKRQDAITRSGLALGTLNYMAPEQIAGLPIDGRVDVYALGVLAFEMLSGALPFRGDSLQEIVADILYRPPPSLVRETPGFDPEADAVLQRAMAKEPDARFARASDLVHALSRLRFAPGLQLADETGHRTCLRAAGTSIGRGPDNDVVAAQGDVSRYHLRICCQADGWFVTDLGSTNGTFVNGHRLTPYVPHLLSDGDELRLADQLTFWAVGASPRRMAEPRTTALR